jgi:hypothetical protein
VLAAATDAARQGRLLSNEERQQAEAPILFPERWAAEQERARAAAEQVQLMSIQGMHASPAVAILHDSRCCVAVSVHIQVGI